MTTLLIYFSRSVFIWNFILSTFASRKVSTPFSKIFCHPDKINISKLNISPSIFYKRHISLYCIVHVFYIKVSARKGKVGERKAFQNMIRLSAFLRGERLLTSRLPFHRLPLSTPCPPPRPLFLVYTEPLSRRREMVDISANVSDFPLLFLQ